MVLEHYKNGRYEVIIEAVFNELVTSLKKNEKKIIRLTEDCFILRDIYYEEEKGLTSQERERLLQYIEENYMGMIRVFLNNGIPDEESITMEGLYKWFNHKFIVDLIHPSGVEFAVANYYDSSNYHISLIDILGNSLVNIYCFIKPDYKYSAFKNAQTLADIFFNPSVTSYCINDYTYTFGNKEEPLVNYLIIDINKKVGIPLDVFSLDLYKRFTDEDDYSIDIPDKVDQRLIAKVMVLGCYVAVATKVEGKVLSNLVLRKTIR